MRKNKKVKKLFLSLETLRKLEGINLANVAGASVVQCTLYESCEGTCSGPVQTSPQCTLACDSQ